MSPLLRKETRMLLPAWIAALLAALTPLWRWQYGKGVSLLIFVAAVLALALSPFGQEMSCGTFGLLLVQPEERRRFWKIKTRLLAMALASAWTLFALCLWTQVWTNSDCLNTLVMSALLTFLAFSGGLWTTLLLRDMVSSFFCAFLVPWAICAVTIACLGHWIDFESYWIIPILFLVLAAYGVAGVLWARRLFLGAQDVAWTGGQISLTVRGVPLRWLAFKFKGRQNRWTALVKKELQLQEITMFLIPVLALLQVAALALCHFHPKWGDIEVISRAIPFLWLGTVPLVIGCVAVAEERRLNTLESLLCLPISKRASFEVKLAVALVLGITLGGVIPWILLHWSGVKVGDFQMRYAMLIAAVITGIAFYASTMSRGLLQTIPTALCIPTVMWTAVNLSMRSIQYNNEWGQAFASSYLFPALLLPAMTVTFVWLAFNNYKRLQIGWRVWVGDFIRAGAVAGCVTLAAMAIFDRCWELFLPLEPRHGPARISGAGRANMAATEAGVFVLLPDGRLWIGKQLWIGKKERSLKIVPNGFAGGSNWTKIAASFNEAVAIQSDGTLWNIGNKSDIRQIGSDSDWQEISAGGGVFLALKQDGTLWGWGHDRYGIISEKSEGSLRDIEIADPVRVQKGSDWVKAFVLNNVKAMGIKRDGSAWEWGYRVGRMDASRRMHQLARSNMEGTDWVSIAGTWSQYTLGIRSDGSLWANGTMPSKMFDEHVSLSLHRETSRVGTKSDWVALSSEGIYYVALEANGTLWTMESDQSKHPSKYATGWPRQ
jgi:hypothetical protein